MTPGENSIYFYFLLLQRIVNIVEEYSKNLSDSVDNVNDEKYTYLDAKKLSTANKSSLTKDRNFFNIPVSTNFSTVHIPTDVYFGSKLRKFVIRYRVIE